MTIDDLISDFNFIATNNLQSSLASYRGQWIILYFYPKDSTPGCTIEGRDFKAAYEAFKALNAVIFGVSRDTIKSHENFKTKQEFPFELISDETETLCTLFDVIKLKSMYGKKLRGIERSTFIINPQGQLKYIGRKVKVIGHVEDILTMLKALQE